MIENPQQPTAPQSRKPPKLPGRKERKRNWGGGLLAAMVTQGRGYRAISGLARGLPGKREGKRRGGKTQGSSHRELPGESLSGGGITYIGPL